MKKTPTQLAIELLVTNSLGYESSRKDLESSGSTIVREYKALRSFFSEAQMRHPDRACFLRMDELMSVSEADIDSFYHRTDDGHFIPK